MKLLLFILAYYPLKRDFAYTVFDFSKELRNLIDTDMTALDIFSGAGGLAHGAMLAGLEITTAIEKDEFAARTYRKNHPGSDLIVQDIRKIALSDLPKDKNERILFGGPPCQGFSTSNQRTRNHDNPNIQLVKEFVRIASIWSPDCIVFENVRGFYSTLKGEYFKYVTNEVTDLGYTCSWSILNSADYGVPQSRSRFFLIASRSKNEISFPKRLKEKVTVNQAFSGLPCLANGASESYKRYGVGRKSNYAVSLGAIEHEGCWNNVVTKNSQTVINRYSHIKQGENWESIPSELMRNYKDKSRCHTGIYRRLKSTEPSVVIGNYRKNMLIHPTENRGLSVREAARLQSFRDDFIFEGSIGSQQQQVGNAVPPLLARSVFEHVLKSL